jgi:hypothetical protein
MNWEKITSMLFPVLITAVGWMISSVNSMQADLIDIKSKMPALITPQGVPTDSPLSATERVKLKEELNKEISELNIRIRILEEHEKRK